MRNIDKYLSLLNDEVDGLLLTSPYSRYIESAQRDLKYFEVLPINQFTGFIKRINDAIEDFGITTLGYEEAYLTVAELMGYEKNLNAKLVPFNKEISLAFRFFS